MAMWDQLGERMNTRQMMESDLGGLEDSILDSAYAELQQRRSQRRKPSGLGLAFSSRGADDYFQRQANEGDAAFLRSYLGSGERPRVRVGYAANETGKKSGNDLYELQRLLMDQRLREQGFK